MADPRGFLLDQAHPLVVDEVQLVGDRLHLRPIDSLWPDPDQDQDTI